MFFKAKLKIRDGLLNSNKEDVMKAKDLNDRQVFMFKENGNGEGKIYIRLTMDARRPNEIPAKRIMFNIYSRKLRYSAETTWFKPKVVSINCML